MPPYQGRFIVLEGADGSGKGTQYRLLTERLKAVGYEVAIFDFPRYDQPSSHFVKSYLNGDYGPATSINPYAASLFFALDRYEAAPEIKKALEEGKIVLSNRYVGSNMAHQGSKFTRPAERRGFFIWEENLEYEVLGIPRPHLNLFLRVPAEVSFELIAKKAARQYTTELRDEHEADINHLQESVATYDLLCRLFPKDFLAIDCTRKGKLLGIAEINELIWQQIKPLLPEPHHSGKSVTIKLGGEPLKTQTVSGTSQRPAETESFSAELSAMAIGRLMSLPGLALKRGIATGETYYTPPGLPKALLRQYRQIMDRIFKLRRQLRGELETYISHQAPKSGGLANKVVEAALSQIRPLAAVETVQINLPAEPVSWPELLELQAIRPVKGRTDGQPSKIIEKILDDLLVNLAAEPDNVRLLQASPRNEFDVLADALYADSDRSRDEITTELDSWTYERKHQSMAKLLTAATGKLLSNVVYRWELTADFSSISELKSAGILIGPEPQAATPRFGYQTPEIIEQVGLDELYAEAFDLSLELYSALQAAGRQAEAGYAVLHGHRGRWRASTTAKGLESIANRPGGGGRALAAAITAKVIETHPLIGEYLSRPKPKGKPTPARSKPGRRSRTAQKDSP